MYQLTIVYRININGEWRQGIYRNLFASYAEAHADYEHARFAADQPEGRVEILEWDIT